MNPETNKSSYIRDIESYFLRVTGKGLMLSSRDYTLINNWYRKSISKDKILKAIQKAVELNESSGIKGISSIEKDIEKYVKSSDSPSVEHNTFSNSFEKNIELKPLLERLSYHLENVEDNSLKRVMEQAKKKVEDLRYRENINLYTELKRVENEFTESLFGSMNIDHQNRILKEAENRLPGESRLFDEESRSRSLKAFRDEIMLNELSLQNLFTLN